MITVYSNAKDTTNPNWVDVDVVLNNIKNCKIKDKIDAIRNETDTSKKRRLKSGLPSICFAGKFQNREDGGIIEHSGLCVLDFDHLENVNETKEQMKEYPFVYSAFVSPSGDGLKVLVRIPKDIEKHSLYYDGLIEKFPTLDRTSRNISRVCFESIDPDIYINEIATEFTELVEEKNYQKEKPLGNVYGGYTDYSKANIPLKMIREAVDGHKHETLLRASKLMGGYVGGGIITEEEAVRLLENEMRILDNGNFEGDKKTIKAGIEYGKKLPIVEVEKEIKIIAKDTGVISVDRVWESMKKSFYEGKARGTTTHFPEFDENFTWKKGEISLIIGKGNSGKTEFILQLMLLKSVKDGWKWGVFSPENYPADEFYDTLIHAYIGKTTDPHYKQNQMSFDEYERGYKFINKHFFYVYPNEMHTIEEIEANFIALIEKEKINGTLIDPFNQIVATAYERDDQFLSAFLTRRKTFSVKYQLCDVICTHPKNMQKNKNGEYDVADVYDIAGGAMWSNKIDNILSVFRPNYISDPKSTLVEIHVKKIKKQKLVGVPGMKQFDFDRKKNRYYQNGTSPFETVPQQTTLQPNNEFFHPDKHIEPVRYEEEPPF